MKESRNYWSVANVEDVRNLYPTRLLSKSKSVYYSLICSVITAIISEYSPFLSDFD